MTARDRLVGGRYRLAEKIGHGGMGQVWAAYDEQLDRRVAVKLLRTDLALADDGRGTGTARTELRERFRRECRVTAGLDHPGLVTVYDAGEDGDDLYLVMQRVPGLSLADLVAEDGPLPVARAVAVAAQVCAALAAVHAVPVVHRDLKPSNVMVRDDGRVVVLDLGIAAVLEPDATRLTRTGGLVGSPPYMAPEQALSATADPRSDLYALGCMLHEMLCGEPPFRAPTALGVLHRHADDPPVPLRELRPEVPAALEALVLALLAKQPRDRPADAQEVYRLLLPLLPAAEADPAAALRPYGPLPDPSRPYRHPLAPQPVAPRPAAPQPAGPSAAGPSAPRPPGPGRPAPSPYADGAASRDGTGTGLADACRRVPELLDAGRLSEVIDLAARVLPAAGKRHGDEAPLVRTLRRVYARTLLVERRYRTALPEWRLLARAAAAERGPDDAEALECRRQAAVCLEQLGENAAALAEYRELLPLLQARLDRGLDHDPGRVLDLRERVGRLLAAEGDPRGAREVLLQLLLDEERRHGPHHPGVVRLREGLEWVQRGLRAPASAPPVPDPRPDPRSGSWPAVRPGPVPGNPYASDGGRSGP
ncbi:serine/threonine-protein kinase [Streptacidiphilus sp. ASG 303]|uniref:serine/threonine-protein kinase n=1 Tax=Streptacidiphilus sp. ASG 303 TaxID=2896847 RepID=UPI0027DF8302|nr:serine/threonine-protein kinase [Streptacidiphilus sp. ASG 303]